MGFWGLVLATVVNIFMIFMQQDTRAGMGDHLCGALVFAGFAATEAQMIKEMRTTGIEGSDEETKEAVFGAMLFLVTFFNLFSFLTRIFGEED